MTRRRSWTFLAAPALAFMLVAPAPAGADGAGEETLVIHRDLAVPMSDGVRLSTDVFLPPGEGPFPTVLIRTAYGKHQMDVFTQYFAGHGYAAVVQDVRGKWESDGEIVPFVSEQQDGLATLDWVAAQSWCNGRVGMWGSSYLSFCALSVAAAQHPALKTVFNMSGWLNGDKINNPGGALHWMLILVWTLHEATQETRSLKDYDINDLFRFIPLKDTMASIGIDDPIFSNPDTLETVRYDYAAIQIPILHMTGWYDFIYPAALTVYDEVAANTSHFQKLIVGPWVHDQMWTTYTESGDEDFGPGAAMGIERINALAVRWFDRWLKDAENGVTDEAPVEIFVMGRNDWVRFERWPPKDVTYDEWFLASGGHANSLHGDGALAPSPADAGAASDTFLFDPMDPVPTTGGANFHFFPDVLGVRDQRPVEERQDVLVYTSAPLDRDLTICGPVRVIIHASTEGKDTDFTAKLVEVRRDGYARNLVEGVIRASFRHSLDTPDLLEPGRVYELTIDLGATAIRIASGHRLRLEISSSNFPKYDRNPNTGEHPWEALEYRTTRQTIYHDSDRPSRIVLPVLRDGAGGS